MNSIARAPPDVRDPVAVGGAAERAAGDLALVLLLDDGEDRLEGRERQAQPPRQLGAGQLAGQVQRLQDQLGDEIAAEAGLVQ